MSEEEEEAGKEPLWSWHMGHSEKTQQTTDDSVMQDALQQV
ncbi:mCG64399 [Mus musculus]|nr:mCG64399 [Mus musculus]